MEDWAQRLRDEAEAKRLSYAEIARMIDAEPNTVRKWAQGRISQPRGKTFELLAKALGVEALWLRDGLGPKHPGDVRGRHDSAASGHERTARLDFGRRLRESRERRGLTIEQACVGLTVPQDAWKAMETGNVSPSLSELQAVSAKLRESLDWLVNGDVANASRSTVTDRDPPPPRTFHQSANPWAEKK